nr:PREDICTED: zinc finger BED domain-containing protein 5-like [Latimeria chalumnae]|eukprot:XP_006005906.1 PREDICTED: zinc finger BED domain-containing protein 5-like [Latimeria chalumnae]
MGFTWTGAGEYPQPQCVLCGEVLSNNSLKPSLLRRHLETKHEQHKDKPPEFFKWTRAQLMASKKVLHSAAADDNIKALEASYLVSYRIANSGKPHTIAEELILSAATDMVSTILGENAPKLIQLVPISNNTVSRRIDDMANDVLTQLTNRVISSQYFALQLDESTDMAGLAHLLVYVRYIYEGAIQEDILFCQSLPTRTTAEEIFRLLDSFINQHDIVWSKCIGICTDGVKSMTGRHSGVVTRIRAVAPNAMWVHCSIHREALAAKSMPTNLKEVLDNAVKMVNFIKARPLNSRIFSALCNEMGSEHVNLLLHTEVRWLSQGKVLARFFELHSEVKVFFTDHPFPLSHCLHDTAWLSWLGYLSDIFSRLNELNLGLQGLSATIFNVQDKIESMIKKLEFWARFVEENTEILPNMHEFLTTNELQLQDSVKGDIKQHLTELARQLREYFPSMGNTNSWVRYPFTNFSAVPMPQDLSIKEQESLLDISTDGGLKIESQQKQLAEFWIQMRAKFPELSDRAVEVLIPFATTYLCESGFLSLTGMKSKYRQHLCVENNLRLKLSPITPNIMRLCLNKQSHPSH